MRAAARIAGLLLALLPPCAASAAGPQGPSESAVQDWSFNTDLTGRVEYYNVDGDASQSPYRFTGWQPYGELNLGADHRFSPWHRLRAQFLGLVADNNYRTDHDGVVVERATVSFENGTSVLPYRFDAGDTYAYFSQRTVQRPLKGVQVEMQGRLTGELRQSLQIVSGLYKRNWRDLAEDTDVTSGASWLLDAANRGRVSLSYLDNRREETVFTPRRDQRLFSVAGQAFLADRRLSVEGEAAHLKEDAQFSDSPEDRRSDDGWLVQVQNGTRPMPLIYRVRFEQYGNEYQPAGAPIIPNRRTREGHLGWRFPTGLELRGRVIDYRDALESPDPLDSTTAGLSLRGPLFSRHTASFNGTFDFFVQNLDDRNRITDSRAVTFVADVVKGIRGMWTPRLHYFYQDTDDRTLLGADQKINELGLGVDRAVLGYGFSGSVGPGLMLRWIDRGPNQGTAAIPTLGVNLARGPHSVRQEIGWETLERDDPAVSNIGTFSYHLIYRLALRHDDFGIEYDNINRNPEPGNPTQSYRAAAYWVRHFGFNAPSMAPGPVAGGVEETLASRSGPVDLAELIPGSSLSTVLARLERAGIQDRVQLGNLDSYVTTLLTSIPQRQRLYLIQKDGLLERSGLVIDADEFGSDADFLVGFEQVRRILLERYGSPSNIHDEGDPVGDLRTRVNGGSFIRLTEWRRPEGTLRYGIPRRLDGRLTLELQFARNLPGVTDARWSIVDAAR